MDFLTTLLHEHRSGHNAVRGLLPTLVISMSAVLVQHHAPTATPLRRPSC